MVFQIKKRKGNHTQIQTMRSPEKGLFEKKINLANDDQRCKT
jgi:hypothetical protein